MNRNYNPDEPLIHPLAIIGGEPQHFQGYTDTFPVILGENVKIKEFTSVDRGTVRNTVIGDNTYIMSRSNLGHDVVIGKNVDISDSCVIGGHAEIGDNVRIGFGSMILPYRKLGNNSRVGSGSVVVMREVPAYAVVAGNPARILYYVCPGCGKHQVETAIKCDECVWEEALANQTGWYE